MNVFVKINQLYARAVTRRDAVHETLRPGSKGQDVEAMLGLLRQLGYTAVNRDVYGPEQEPQVRAFQDDHLLTADGIVGRKTWAALYLACQGPSLRQVITARPSHAVRRINSLFQLWPSLGYYSSTASNTDQYVIGRANSAQRAIAAGAGRTATHGMTCGHFMDYTVKLYLGIEDPRVRHTGQNLSVYWRERDSTDSFSRSSSVGVGLLKGKRIIDAGTWSPRVHGCWPYVSTQLAGSELELIEYGSHIIGRLHVGYTSGIMDPRTGLLARVGTYRVGADGTKAMPGRSHTFRLWRESDDAGIRNVYGVDSRACNDRPIAAELGV